MYVGLLVFAGAIITSVQTHAALTESVAVSQQFAAQKLGHDLLIRSQALAISAPRKPAPFGFEYEVASSLILLGDLYRDGKIGPTDGARALNYYRGLSSRADSSSLYAIIAPVNLITTEIGTVDPDMAVSLYHQAAAIGNPEALLRLGNLYVEGRVVARDYKTAFAFYQQAAEAGSDEGKLRVGEMTVLGRGTARNVDQGLAMIDKLAQSGNTEALVLLGDFHRPGELGVKTDPVKALGLYRQAAELGSDPAKLRVGEMLAIGQGTARDVAAGLATINEVVARTGDASGLVLLGMLYSRTSGGVIAVDLKQAFEYFKRAAQAGDETGILRMGEMLAQGRGTARDFAAGRDMVRNLANKSNPFALISLGDILSDASLAPVEANAAAEAYEKAAALGHSYALVRLGDLYSRNGAVKTDLKKAYECYQRASDVGDVAGKLRVGEMMMLGQGTPQDIETGLALIETLAESGDADALVLLGNLYRQQDTGVVNVDLAKSFDYYKRAAGIGSVVGTLRAGEMLARGQGTAQDVKAGRALVQALAEAENPSALMSFGDLLSDRTAGTIDMKEAEQAYEKAAALGRPEALVRLGDIYRFGAIVTADPAKALKFYDRAQIAGEMTGKLRVGEMTALGEGTEQNVNAGLALVRQVADAGDGYAYVILGDLHSSGLAGPLDGEAALAAYEKAAQQGRIDAMLRLGDLYRDGKGVPIDGKKAAEYYLKAANAEAIPEANEAH